MLRWAIYILVMGIAARRAVTLEELKADTFENKDKENVTLEELIMEIFETTADEDNHRVVGGERCETIEGALRGDCFDCHPCDSPTVKGHAAGMQRLQLQTESCSRRGELCCVPVTPDLRLRSPGNCGVAAHTTAEHPWGAALYRRAGSDWKRACSALAIGSRALLTTARCAVSASLRDLRVRIGDDMTLHTLRQVAPNLNYSAAGWYDAAVLLLTDEDAELQSACLPAEPPRPGQVCATMQDLQPPVYSRVGSQDVCDRMLRGGGAELHRTQLCSIIDLEPAQFDHAAPLLCKGPDGWAVVGLASYLGLLTDGVHLHTRVDALSGWLRDQLRAWDAV